MTLFEIHAEGEGEDGRGILDAEPLPVGEEGVAGVGGDGGDAVEREEFAEVSGETRDRGRRGEFGEAEREGVEKEGDARAADVREELGKFARDGGGEEFGFDEGVEVAAESVSGRATEGATEASAEFGEGRPVGAAFSSALRLGEVGAFPRFEQAPGVEERIECDGPGVGAEVLQDRASHALDAGARRSVARVGEIDQQHGPGKARRWH
jgi:hypothetical protein